MTSAGVNPAATEAPPIEYVYVVVCSDLPLAHQAVQACHAAVAAGRDLVRVDEPHLILVTVPDEDGIISLSQKLYEAGVDHRTFCEADLGDRATALATAPIRQKQRKHLAHLPLYRPAAAV